MIVAAAFCPHPPVLVPEAAQGAAPELDDVRTACRAAITRVAAPERQLVLIGAGAASRAHRATAGGTLAGYGVPLELGLGAAAATGPIELPLSLTVGAWLARDALGPNSGAIGFSVGAGWDGGCGEEFRQLTAGERDIALVVLGDGSARRSTAAPGYLDARAEQFDASIAGALRAGAPRGLLRTEGAARLLVAGAPVWNAVAASLAGRSWDAELLYDAAPYGVAYFVATWS